MKLTVEQLDYIKNFIKKKGFTYIDVQMELLDHVACKVEERLIENPSLSFEKTFIQVYKEFGIFGFSSFEEAYSKGLYEKYSTIRRKEMLTWLTSPRIVYTLLTAILLYLIYDTFSVTTSLVIGGILLLVPSVYWFSTLLKSWRKYKKMLTMRASETVFIPALAFQIWANMSMYISKSPWWGLVYVGILVAAFLALQADMVVRRNAQKRCDELESVYGNLVTT